MEIMILDNWLIRYNQYTVNVTEQANSRYFIKNVFNALQNSTFKIVVNSEICNSCCSVPGDSSLLGCDGLLLGL